MASFAGAFSFNSTIHHTFHTIRYTPPSTPSPFHCHTIHTIRIHYHAHHSLTTTIHHYDIYMIHHYPLPSIIHHHTESTPYCSHHPHDSTIYSNIHTIFVFHNIPQNCLHDDCRHHHLHSTNRDNDDCWLDERLMCNDYALVRADINRGW